MDKMYHNCPMKQLETDPPNIDAEFDLWNATNPMYNCGRFDLGFAK